MNERRRGNYGPATRAVHVLSAERLRMSIFVRCELEAGVRRARRPPQEEQQIAWLAQSMEIVFPGEDFAVHYGEIEFTLRAGGQMIPTMDLLIGTHCVCANEALLTSNAHFQRIPGLSVIRFDRFRPE